LPKTNTYNNKKVNTTNKHTNNKYNNINNKNKETQIQQQI